MGNGMTGTAPHEDPKTEVIGELVIRIPVVKGVFPNGVEFFAAWEGTELVSSTIPEEHKAAVGAELDDGDFWGDSDLYASIHRAFPRPDRETDKQ